MMNLQLALQMKTVIFRFNQQFKVIFKGYLMRGSFFYALNFNLKTKNSCRFTDRSSDDLMKIIN